MRAVALPIMSNPNPNPNPNPNTLTLTLTVALPIMSSLGIFIAAPMTSKTCRTRAGEQG